MSDHLVWCIVMILGALGVLAAFTLLPPALPTSASGRPGRGSIVVLVGALVALAVLAGLWRVHAIARADGSILDVLARHRSATLATIFSYVTTMGDLLPSMTIATAFAIVLYLNRATVAAFILPIIVLVEIGGQTVIQKAAHDQTVATAAHAEIIGGAGSIPSGSMARLLSIFALAVFFWHRLGRRDAAVRLGRIGAVLVFVELVSRLVLTRHLLADIVGGLLFGIALTIVGAWCVHPILRSASVGSDPANWRRPARGPARWLLFPAGEPDDQRG